MNTFASGISEILDLSVFGTGILSIFIVYALWLKKYFSEQLRSDHDRKELTNSIQENTEWKHRLRSKLQKKLDWLDNFLSSNTLRRPDNLSIKRRASLNWYWSGKAYGYSLIIAMTYPSTLIFFFWLLGNNNTTGIADMLPENIPLYNRYLGIFLLLLSAITCINITIKNVLSLLAALTIYLVYDSYTTSELNSSKIIITLVILPPFLLFLSTVIDLDNWKNTRFKSNIVIYTLFLLLFSYLLHHAQNDTFKLYSLTFLSVMIIAIIEIIRKK